MNAAPPLLALSIVLNLLLLRWALGEYAARRKYQKQTLALEEAMRLVHKAPSGPGSGVGPALLFAGLLVAVGVILLVGG